MSKEKITLDGKLIQINQEEHFSLLLAMEKNNLNVEYSCLMGVCGACEVKVCKGNENIKYFEEPMLDLEEDSILPCCCTITGDVELKNI